MKHYYIIITKDFAEQNNGYQRGNCVLNTAITTDGRYVVSANALNEFPELFAEINITIIALTPADFPQPEFPPKNGQTT